jgi:hypothetical protein
MEELAFGERRMRRIYNRQAVDVPEIADKAMGGRSSMGPRWPDYHIMGPGRLVRVCGAPLRHVRRDSKMYPDFSSRDV